MHLTQQVTVSTDDHGRYSANQIVNPPGPFDLTARISFQLDHPADLHVTGSFQIAAVAGGIVNPPTNFDGRSGQAVDLGTVRLSGGDNRVVVNGVTDPVTPNTNLQFTITGTLV
jgi:hypothetical protein